MVDVKLQSLEKIDRLQTKIEETLQRLTELNERCETLESKNAVLQERVETLQHRNIALSREIEQLHAARAEEEDDNSEEILKRIDRMLEKFGELQI
jgi:FtsZ-binding cell division protein ZapB